MKKTILLVLVLAFFVNLSAVEFTFNLSERNVSVQNNNGLAVFDWSNAFYLAAPGDPALPIYTVDFILPDDADTSSLSVVIDNPLTDVISESLDVEPAPPTEMGDDFEKYWSNQENIDENGRNRLIYGENGINAFNGFLHQSDNWIKKTIPSKWKSVKLVTVFVRAYDWNPATKKLKKLIGGTLRVSVASSNNTITLSHFSEATAQSLGNLIRNTVNPNSIRIKNIPGNAGNHQLLFSYIQGGINFDSLVHFVFKPKTLYIITTDEIKEASKMLEHFIASKNKRGFSVSVVTQEQTETYYNGKTIQSEGWENKNSYGPPQRADQIRNYLKHNQRYEKIDYLLLIGNPHPGSCDVANANTDLNIFDNVSKNTDCLYDKTKEGDIPMKWINIHASSTWSGFCCDNNGDPFLAEDLRRAMPSDRYFSVLSEDWDPNNDGLVGDGEDGYEDSKELHNLEIENDVILGRIPVYNNNIAELDRYFQKVIRYENTLKNYVPPTINNVQNPNADTIEALRHKVFVMADYMDKGGDDFDETPNWLFAEEINHIHNNISNSSFHFEFMLRNDDLPDSYPLGHTKCSPLSEQDDDEDDDVAPRQFRRFDGNNGGVCEVTKLYSNFFPFDINNTNITINNIISDNNNKHHKWSTSDAAQQWASDKYGMVLWNAHGSRYGAVINTFNPNSPNDPDNVVTLEDYYPVHTFQASCQTGWPEDPDNLALSLLRHGAITTIAANRNTNGKHTNFNPATGRFEHEDDSDFKEWDNQGIVFKYIENIMNHQDTGSAFSEALSSLQFPQFKRNAILFTLYGDPTLGPETWKNSGKDIDNDGIIDEFDNCPKQYNPKQEDDDLDFVGNLCDNCQGDYNPREMNNSEIVVAPCENGNGGAACFVDSKYTYKDKNGNWWWQPDHDLDGTGDACDPDDIEWAEFLGTPVGKSVVVNVYQNSTIKVDSVIENQTLSVGINILKSEPTQASIQVATTRYCWLPERIKDSWGTDGHCTTEAKHKTDFSEYCDTNFGYSHGTDPQPADSEGNPNWKSINKKIDHPEESNEFTEIESCNVADKAEKSKTIDWDWRSDFKQDRPWDVGSSLDTAPTCRNFSFGRCNDDTIPKFYYTMSTGVHGTASNYLTEDHEINENFFKDGSIKYNRSSRLLLNETEISYFSLPVPILAPIKYCFSAGCNFQMEWLHDMIIDRLIHGPLPFEMPITEHYFKNDYGSDLINTGVAFREWNKNALGMPSVVEKSRPLLLLTITKNASGMNEGILAVQNNTIFSLRNIQEAVSSNFTFEIVTMDANSNGDWRTKGVLDVSNIPNFMPITSTYHNRDLYVVSKNGGNTAHIYRIDKTDQTITPQQFINICPLRWIFEPIDLGTLPNLSNITIHSVGNSLFALGKTTSGMKVYKLSEQNGNPYFEDISGTILPEGRDVYNVEIQDDVLYLAGGAEFGENSADLKTDIWRFTETDGWQLIRNDINMFPVTLRIDFDGDNIILTDRVIRPNGTTNRAIFAADGTGDILIENIPVEGAHIQSYGNYCMKESDSALQGGLEMGGECVPFTHPWYNSFSAGATVYSLDGKGERLYLGTNNAIKVYDISDPISPVLVSSFSTGSRVNDLEVYGDTLFAATNGGLYKLDASNDTLTQTLFVSAFLNSQYKVEVYNGKLYVGDDNGIKVRDLETLSVLTSVNNGSVLDFAIENGEIGLYKDALLSPVEIRDAETLTLKANEFFGCFEIEVGSSDGRFYLSCDDEIYKFEDDGDGGISFTELSGDIRELQDVYTYNGYTYFYDENTIWISTSNDVPALCGNGIVEGDEVCDGGQIDCEELDSNYVSGTATCNSTCDGYNTNNCSDDGW